MNTKKVLSVLGLAVLAGLVLGLLSGSPADATTQPKCQTTFSFYVAKNDNGHGTPSEWASLHLKRTVKVNTKNHTVSLFDVGSLTTIKGAGTPNGTGGQILNSVPGAVVGHYTLTYTGGNPTCHNGNTSLSSTEYVKSLFTEGTTVTGGDYAWYYKTRCGEHWLDSSKNNDGQGAQAGNITGKLCKGCPGWHKPPYHHPTPKPTTPKPTPTTPVTQPGEAAPAVPVHTQPHFTG
jgi:hypothetical protein